MPPNEAGLRTDRRSPERLGSEAVVDELLEVEHRGRYWWAASFASGLRVLDAGCGLGDGAAILAEAGAEEVEAVETVEEVAEAARARVGDRVRVECADIAALPYPAASFDMVTCLGVLGGAEDPTAVLDELLRVLRPSGLLVLSCESRHRQGWELGDGRPEHTLEQLADKLRERFAEVRLAAQWRLLGSLIEDGVEGPGAHTPADPAVRRLVDLRSAEKSPDMALCSNAELPSLSSLVALAGAAELERLLGAADELRETIRGQDAVLRRQEGALADHAALGERLASAEAELARIADLEQDLAAARAECDELRARAEWFEREFRAADNVLAVIRKSHSWRLTAPLRALTQRVRSRR